MIRKPVNKKTERITTKASVAVDITKLEPVASVDGLIKNRDSSDFCSFYIRINFPSIIFYRKTFGNIAVVIFSKD